MRRRRRASGAAVLITALLTTAGCGIPFPLGASRTVSLAGCHSSAASPSPDVESDLARRLLPVPTGGRRLADTAWRRTMCPTTQQYVDAYYQPDNRTEQVNILLGEGQRGVVHEFFTAGGLRDDVILMHFDTPDGAQARYLGLVDVNTKDPAKKTVELSGPGEPTGFYEPLVDSDGNVRGRSYAHVGQTLVEVFSYSRGRFDRESLQAVTTSQVALVAS